MQTKRGYAEGGFLDDGASIDAVSGNEVPTGSLQAEVRDDIPAQLSEGEFVFPADVVRFIGLGQLMKIRDKAKTGLVEMEQEGQIGGSAAPPEIIMDDEDMAMDALIDGMDSEGFEEQAMNFAKGGMPTYEAYTGRKFGENNIVEFTKYTNDEGDIITIKTMKGQPLEEVPEGYYLVGSKPPTEEEEEKPPEDETSTGGGQGKVDNLNDPNNPWRGLYGDTSSDPQKHAHNIRNDKLVRKRRNAIKSIGAEIIAGNVDPRGEANAMSGYATNEDAAVSSMQELMTPEAIAIADRWENSPANFFDKIGLGPKKWSKTEKQLKAQQQVDNAAKAAGVPDKQYVDLWTKGSKKDKQAMYGTTPSVSKFFSDLASGVADFAKSGGMIGALVEMLPGNDDTKKILKDSLTATAQNVAASGTISESDANLANDIDGTISEEEEATPTYFQSPSVKAYQEKEAKKKLKSATAYQPMGTGVAPIERTGFEPSGEPTGATLGETGTLATRGVDGTNNSTSSLKDNVSFNNGDMEGYSEADIRSYAVALGMNPQNMVDNWKANRADPFEEEDNGSISRRDQALINKNDTAGNNARDEAANLIFANESRLKKGLDPVAQAALTDEQRRQQSQTTTNSGNNNNDNYTYSPPTPTEEEKEEESDYDKMHGNAGGLAVKKKPAVKKMRKDPTSGLAAKKKSKQKAKAKKGALAAKRT